MTDVHSGIPHDLPEYEPDTDPLPTRWRVQVYRDRSGWAWVHQCTPKRSRKIRFYVTWGNAFWVANLHAKECCR